MKIHKSDTAECIHRVLRDTSGRHTLAIGLIYPFSLHADCNPKWTQAFSVWPLAQAAMGENALLDEGWPKQRSEFLAYGAAYGGQRSEAQPVSALIQIDRLTKQLAVFGDRHFSSLHTISQPASFDRMPISQDKAYGGEGWGLNPSGKGFVEEKDTGTTFLPASFPLPNIELPDQLVTQTDDRPVPAGFWAYSSDLPQRTKMLGRFDKSWLKERWPHYPVDTHPDYFQTTPKDQWLDTYFKGNEKISIHNMHPDYRGIDTSLPGVRARIFIEQSQLDVEKKFFELNSRLETVWLFPDQLAGLILFRATVEIADSDADDVLAIYAELEYLKDPPGTDAYHYDRYLTLSGQNTEADETVPVENQAPSADTIASTSMAVSALDATSVESSNVLTAPNALEASPYDPADLMNLDTKIEAEILEELPELKQLQEQTQELMKQINLTESEMLAMLPPDEPEITTLKEFKTLTQKQIASVKTMIQEANLTDANIIAVTAEHPDLKEFGEELAKNPGSVEKIMSDFEEALDQMIAQDEEIDKYEAENKQQEDPAPAPLEDGELDTDLPVGDLRLWVVNRHTRQKSFKGLDLSGANLSELDLSGADFSGALLPDVNFTSARLLGCRFDEAMLTNAVLTGADLTGASLQEVSAGNTKFNEARLVKVNLKHADCSNSDFTNVQMMESNLAYAEFGKCEMSGAQAQRCEGEFAGFTSCNLVQANFNNARLRAVNFHDAKLVNASFTEGKFKRGVFTRADLSGAILNQSDLQGSEGDQNTVFKQADLREANLADAVWLSVCLDGATLNNANLSKADLSGSSLVSTSMIRVVAKGAQLSKVKLVDADLSGINLFEGSLRNSTLDNCKLQMANLFGVDFQDTVFNNSSLDASIIERTILSARRDA